MIVPLQVDWMLIDAGAEAVVAGDVLCAYGSGHALAIRSRIEAAGRHSAVVLEGAEPGRYALALKSGIVPPAYSGLTGDYEGAIVVDEDGRPAPAAYSVVNIGDYVLGWCDGDGNLTLGTCPFATGTVVESGRTNDANPLDLVTFPVPDNTLLLLSVSVTGVQDSPHAAPFPWASREWTFQVARQDAAAAAEVGDSNEVYYIRDAGPPLWGEIEHAVVGNDAVIQVTGAAATGIGWKAILEPRYEPLVAAYLASMVVGVTEPLFSWMNVVAGAVRIYWGDGDYDDYAAGWSSPTHTYTDGITHHTVGMVGDVDQIDYLQAQSAGITSIDLSGMTALNTLYISHNELTEIDLSPVAALTDLDLSLNHLASLDCTPCPNLVEVYVYQVSELASIDVTGLASLDLLDLEENQLTSLDVSTCVALTELYVIGNPVTALDVSANVLLTDLVVYDCALSSGLDLSTNVALTSTELQSNAMTEAGVDATLASISGNIGVRPAVADLDLSGTNATPSVPDGCDDYDAIVGHGWTVAITGSCPP